MSEIEVFEQDNELALAEKLNLAAFAKIDKDKKKILKDTLADGATLSVAARKAQVNYQVLKNLLSWGDRDPKGPVGLFARQVRKLQAEAEEEPIKKLREMALAGKNHKDIIEYLKVLDPEAYGPKPNVSATQVNVNFGDILERLDNSNAPGD